MAGLLDHDIGKLIKRLKEKDKVALSRLISIVENDPEKSTKIFNIIRGVFRQHNHQPYVIGITGPAGVGKSSLTNLIAQRYSKKGITVGIISVDPSSPLSGGAFLGDRVRMTELIMDSHIYIRSLASRGSTGGLSRTTYEVCLLMRAFGLDVIIIESVGAGQSQVDIAKMVDSTIVVSVPGLGDLIQVLKAGIIEIGDIHVVNKSDLGGEDVCIEIEMMLDANSHESGWRTPVILTNCITREGIDQLMDTLGNHLDYLKMSGLLEKRRAERIRDKIKTLIVNKIENYIMRKFIDEEQLNRLPGQLVANEYSLYNKVDHLLGDIFHEEIP